MVCSNRCAVVFDVMARCARSARLTRLSSTKASTTAKTFRTAATFSALGWESDIFDVLLFLKLHSGIFGNPCQDIGAPPMAAASFLTNRSLNAKNSVEKWHGV
ncbi:hypothetical protein D3C87_1835060 [compost metagenome]